MRQQGRESGFALMFSPFQWAPLHCECLENCQTGQSIHTHRDLIDKQGLLTQWLKFQYHLERPIQKFRRQKRYGERMSYG